MGSTDRFPEIGKLSVAILEALVKPVIGSEAIKILKEPLAEKQLQDALGEALRQAESRFLSEHADRELCEAVLALPLADLPALRSAVRSFYQRFTDTQLRSLLLQQLETDYSHLESARLERAADRFLNILRQELTQISDDARQKLLALAVLGIHDTLQAIASGGDLYQRFAAVPALSQYIRTETFKTIIEERTRNFVGREFIFKAVEDLTQDPQFPSGYLLVQGEPGIGKTSFMAELIKRRGYVHHFNLSLQNIVSAGDFLTNTCAQLIARYGLDHPTLPPEAANDGGFLSRLLGEVAEREQARPTLILVDALDEADDRGLAPNANILYLPPALPTGVYFLVTTRPKYDFRLVVDRQKDIFIKEDDPQNLEDIRRYLTTFIEKNPGMAPRIAGWEVELAEFVDILTEKSEGNFMYLVHVLNDIHVGRLTPANIDNVRHLPQGLKAYYQRHWRMMRAQDETTFDREQEPVICILATVREPVSLAMVSGWTGLTPRRAKEVIQAWREFLNVDDTGEEEVYRIYHASFQDFLRAEVGLTAYHKLIGDQVLGKIRWTKT